MNQLRRSLDTLSDPFTVVDPTRLDAVKSILWHAEGVAARLAWGSDSERSILDRCYAVRVRWGL